MTKEDLAHSEALTVSSSVQTERGSQIFWRGFQDGVLKVVLISNLIGISMAGMIALVVPDSASAPLFVAASMGIGTPLLSGIARGFVETAFPTSK